MNQTQPGSGRRVLSKTRRAGELAVRHVGLAASRRLVRVPIALITDEFGFSPAPGGWNHYTALLADVDRNPGSQNLDRHHAGAPPDGEFRWFFHNEAVNEVRDLNDLFDLGSPDPGFQQEPRFWLGTYPWGGLLADDVGSPGQPFGWAYDRKTGADTSELWGRGRNLWYRPDDESTLRNEWRLTVELYRSIRRSYSPLRSRGFPTVAMLRHLDGARRAVIIDGHHRLAVLAHLGATSVTVEVESTIDLADVDRWYHVRTGYCSAQQAARFFQALFDLNGSERVSRLATVSEGGPARPSSGIGGGDER